MKGFRDFILRGNVVDLAVGIVVGAAFGAVVNGFVKAFITPLIGLLVGGRGDFSEGGFTVSGTQFPWGIFITALISFLLIAAVVYFLVVLPVNRLVERFSPKKDTSIPTKNCPECLSSIPEAASRCAFCTAAQPPAAAVTG